MPKQKKLKQFHIKGISIYAHGVDEAFEVYKKQHIVETGDMLRIDKKFFRVIGEKLHEILTR